MLSIIGCGGAGAKFANYIASASTLRPIIINDINSNIKVDRRKVEAYSTVDGKLISMAFPWIGKINSPYIFVIAGLGGVIGTGMARIFGRTKKHRTKLIGLFTLPFSSENKERREYALKALNDIGKYYDMYFILDNDGLVKHYSHIPITVAMQIPAEVMKHIVLDFKNIMIKNILNVPIAGELGIGIGFGTGKNRLDVAIKDALDSPWIGEGEKIMLFSGNIDIEDAKVASRNYNPIFVDVFQTQQYGEEVKVTVITLK